MEQEQCISPHQCLKFASHYGRINEYAPRSSGSRALEQSDHGLFFCLKARVELNNTKWQKTGFTAEEKQH